MANVTVQARITPELKEEAEAILASMGFTTADAIRVFLQQIVNTGELPFQPTTKQPNAATIEAMDELENGGGQVFTSTEELFADWKQ